MAKAHFNLEGKVGEIVIADPPLNLFGRELLDDLGAATEEAERSDARAILVRAEGDNFSGGANVEIFLDRDEAAARELLSEFVPLIRRAAALPVPVVAAVNGLCIAAGLEVALTADMIWAGESAQLGLVEAVIPEPGAEKCGAVEFLVEDPGGDDAGLLDVADPRRAVVLARCFVDLAERDQQVAQLLALFLGDLAVQ